MEASLAERLVSWYREHRRDLPFRRTRDPYAIIVAEVLLQRTRMASGVPYYERFMARFPTVEQLAAAREEEVLKAWEGLGFYGRARNLHRAAKAITAGHRGDVPTNFADLRALPGIGDYTAGAVASIAFGERVPAIDGNAVRVLARVFRLAGDLRRGPARRRLMTIAASLVPASEPGQYNQALMELGATVCHPKAPRCPECPLRTMCGAYINGSPQRYPKTPPRQHIPVVRVAFAVAVRDGKVLLVRRPPTGLLAGLWALPGGELPPKGSTRTTLLKVITKLGLTARLDGVVAPVEHTFSHQRWVGAVYHARVAGSQQLPESATWASAEDLRHLPLVPFHRRLLEARFGGFFGKLVTRETRG